MECRKITECTNWIWNTKESNCTTVKTTVETFAGDDVIDGARHVIDINTITGVRKCVGDSSTTAPSTTAPSTTTSRPMTSSTPASSTPASAAPAINLLIELWKAEDEYGLEQRNKAAAARVEEGGLTISTGLTGWCNFLKNNKDRVKKANTLENEKRAKEEAVVKAFSTFQTAKATITDELKDKKPTADRMGKLMKDMVELNHEFSTAQKPLYAASVEASLKAKKNAQAIVAWESIKEEIKAHVAQHGHKTRQSWARLPAGGWCEPLYLGQE